MQATLLYYSSSPFPDTLRMAYVVIIILHCTFIIIIIILETT